MQLKASKRHAEECVCCSCCRAVVLRCLSHTLISTQIGLPIFSIGDKHYANRQIFTYTDFYSDHHTVGLGPESYLVWPQCINVFFYCDVKQCQLYLITGTVVTSKDLLIVTPLNIYKFFGYFIIASSYNWSIFLMRSQSQRPSCGNL